MSIENNSSILSISQMARLLNLSRSRLYQLISEGIFLPPIYSPEHKRPYFTGEIAEKNLQVKKRNVGINGKIVLFYSSRTSSLPKIKNGKQNNGSDTQPAQDNHQDLKDGLAGLGLSNISDTQIESALENCFPGGTENVDAGEILRAVFLSIKRQDSRDNENR